MKKLSFLSSLVFILLFTFTSCKKDETTPPLPNAATPKNPMPVLPSNVAGALIAVQTQTKPPVIIPGMPFEMINVGTAVAVFPASATTYADAGNVTVNTFPLTKNADNTYLYNITATNPLGLEFTTAPSWSVSGSGAIPAFTAMGPSFPADVNITSATTVNSAAAYTLTSDNITGADSIIFAVHGPTASLVRTMGASSSSFTFSAAELATVGKGYGYIQMAAVKFKPTTNGGKNYWLINENVSTIGATIQ